MKLKVSANEAYNILTFLDIYKKQWCFRYSEYDIHDEYGDWDDYDIESSGKSLYYGEFYCDIHPWIVLSFFSRNNFRAYQLPCEKCCHARKYNLQEIFGRGSATIKTIPNGENMATFYPVVTNDKAVIVYDIEIDYDGFNYANTFIFKKNGKEWRAKELNADKVNINRCVGCKNIYGFNDDFIDRTSKTYLDIAQHFIDKKWCIIGSGWCHYCAKRKRDNPVGKKPRVTICKNCGNAYAINDVHFHQYRETYTTPANYLIINKLCKVEGGLCYRCDLIKGEQA